MSFACGMLRMQWSASAFDGKGYRTASPTLENIWTSNSPELTDTLPRYQLTPLRFRFVMRTMHRSLCLRDVFPGLAMLRGRFAINGPFLPIPFVPCTRCNSCAKDHRLQSGFQNNRGKIGHINKPCKYQIHFMSTGTRDFADPTTSQAHR